MVRCEMEISRHNVSAKAFYSYCGKKLARIGAEDWLPDFDSWANGSMFDKPFETQQYSRGCYNFILEWDGEDYGYMYLVEYEEEIA